MKIKINVEDKILKKFEIDNLPDFIVVTGENGSGKTQLLKILSIENWIEEKFENETFIQYSKSEIFDGEKKMNNINYISNNDEMQDHYNVNLGQNITPQVYIDKWGRLPIKYVSYLNLKKISNKNISLENLNKRYQKDIGNNNSITQSDLNLFEKIYSQKINKFELATIEECIINLPFSNNNNLFSTDLTLLYIKHKCKLDLGIIPKEKPWDIFNKILEEANFPYRLNPPDFSVENFNLRANLIDIKSKKIIEIPNLSSGEKTIMSLILALYNSKNEITFPEVILFDEPDSVLHPSMSKQMLDVLQNIFVKQQQVKVIITTHSPSTVALSPELSIYKMDRDLGMLLKIEKKEAINNLTKGLDNLNIYYENRRQIFVKANIDKLFYENTYSNIKSLGNLNRQIHLEFITMSETKQNGDVNGGCDFVKKNSESSSKIRKQNCFWTY
ncbi:ATP-binding protein [Aquimarina agarivorans]|uniref:ATP-binding protein n=1 Tax=Aquimarina agarivorans TaxID=980584 RepID=UPI0003193EBB|nr:ATP-binding protein [Aquimarina agarivorans]